MILFLKLIAGAFVVSLLGASILVPWLAHRFRRHDAWINQANLAQRHGKRKRAF